MRVISAAFRESQARKARALHADPAFRLAWLETLARARAANQARLARQRAAFAARAEAMVADHPALRRPRVRAVLEAVSAEHDVPVWQIIGRYRQRTRAAAMARRAVIVALHEPAPGAGSAGHVFHYGLAELGRVLGMDPSSVHYAIRQACGGAP